MSRIPWKEGEVVSIETRPGVFVLGQMLTDPYMVFFNKFSDSLDWPDISLESVPKLFISGVVRQFLSSSTAKYQKHIAPVKVTFASRLIKPSIWAVYRTIWTGTAKQMTLAYIGGSASLIECQRPVRGVDSSERTLISKISPKDYRKIEHCELDSLDAHPWLNERLYLCHLLGRNVNVQKDLILKRPLPSEYETYLRYIAISDEQLKEFTPNEIEIDPKMARRGNPPSELKLGRLE